MLALSHLLDLRELGFASILMAVYGTFEMVTDINISRFVMAAPRENYHETLAAAHALSVVRGLVVGAAAVILSPLIAGAFSLGADWPTFAALGLVIAIRGFEHLEPRIAERDYRYGPQLKVSAVAYGLASRALFGAVLVFPESCGAGRVVVGADASALSPRAGLFRRRRIAGGFGRRSSPGRSASVIP